MTHSTNTHQVAQRFFAVCFCSRKVWRSVKLRVHTPLSDPSAGVRVKGSLCHSPRSAGFTLLEFIVAIAMFLVIGAATLSMFSQNAPIFTQQQNSAGLNISLQNALTQIQLDLVNAGTGYYPGTVIPSWPIGVTVNNQNPTSPCNNSTNYTYSTSCFDTLNILTLNPNVPPYHPTNSSGSTASTSCSSINSSPFYLQPASGQTAAQTAATFNVGDQFLVVKSGSGGSSTQGPNGTNTASNGALYNTFTLNAAAGVGANYVALSFDPPAGGSGAYTTTQEPSDDPLGIAAPADSGNQNLGTSFCASDWVMKLQPTTYSVNLTNPEDPMLQRTQAGTSANIAEQIIGFKVGAATWQTTGSATSTTIYSFNAPAAIPTGYNNNFSLVRSVRVTLIGRTNPNPDPTYTFRNTFDGGPYQVQDASIVVNPRNMTMNGN